MEIQQYLRELIDNIHGTEIVLEEVNSHVYLRNVSLEDIPKWKSNINLDISTVHEFNNESGLIVINAIYTLHEEIVLITSEKRASETESSNDNSYVSKTKIRYRLLLTAKVAGSLRDVLKDHAIAVKLIEQLARTTGILMVFPYLRHMLDVLHKEMRLPIPPLPPFLVEKDANKRV